ncbi:MAG: helix-turn-helix transcriptional regulator [bacterium]|nr:helix-turn-helix transcriptional regulator [bacterium]
MARVWRRSRTVFLGAARSQDQAMLRRVGTAPILALLRKPNHFNEIKRRLPMITDRAMSQSLKSMEDHDWVRRDVDAGVRPPRPLYRAGNLGGRIGRAADVRIRLG